MEKLINIGNKTVPAKSTAGSLFKYKLNFGRDGLQDLTRIAKSMPKKASDDDMIQAIADDKFDLDVLYRFTWIFCKTADPTIPPLTEWLDEFDVSAFEFMSEVFPQIQDLLYSNVKTTIKSKN